MSEQRWKRQNDPIVDAIWHKGNLVVWYEAARGCYVWRAYSGPHILAAGEDYRLAKTARQAADRWKARGAIPMEGIERE